MTQPQPTPKYEWTRSETLALARQNCTFCFGLGMRPGRSGQTSPCNCVFRSIFRACYEKFTEIVLEGSHVAVVSWTQQPNASKQKTYGFKGEEFCADFCTVARRALTEDEHRLFRFHYLLGAGCKICCTKLKMERGYFFHECYRIEQILGRVFRELTPYALFPLDEYFASFRGEAIKPLDLFAEGGGGLAVPINGLVPVEIEQVDEAAEPIKESPEQTLSVFETLPRVKARKRKRKWLGTQVNRATGD